jgi:uncharacterized protein (TIGR02118 family)
MMKVTVLYGIPASPEQFEKYYGGTHLPLAAKMKGLARIELTRFVPGPDGSKPAFHRMAELYFTTPAEMEQSLQSPEGRATVADIPNFATGGVTMIVGTVDGTG